LILWITYTGFTFSDLISVIKWKYELQ
jgi:hypothetical protein